MEEEEEEEEIYLRTPELHTRRDFLTYKHNKFAKKLWHLCGILMACSITWLKLNLLSS